MKKEKGDKLEFIPLSVTEAEALREGLFGYVLLQSHSKLKAQWSRVIFVSEMVVSCFNSRRVVLYAYCPISRLVHNVRVCTSIRFLANSGS